MRSIVIVKLSLLFLIAVSALTEHGPAGPPTFGVFVATSPCDAASKLLLKIPPAAGCELIKWQLTLDQDPTTLAPTTYRLTYTYGLPRQNTNGLAQGGTKVEREGRWAIVRVTNTSPFATLYRLDPDRPSQAVSFLKVDQNLIHLLDGDGRLVVGNAGWSYTLNRAGGDERPTRHARPPHASAAKTNSPVAPLPPITADESAAGTFMGRSPCPEVAAQLNKAVGDDCMKAKWVLTLYQSPAGPKPAAYRLRGTFFRERIVEGTWAIVRGTKANPAAVVYQLDPDKPQGSLFLMKADDNVLLFLDRERNLLVGNGDFSYTLNRAKIIPKN